MRVAVIGAGRVGLVTAACLAEKGHHVVCADVDEERARAIGEGLVSIHEAGLEELVRRTARGGRLRGTTDVRAAVRESEISLLAVPVPIDRGEEESLATLRTVAQQIGEARAGQAAFHAVVVRSTVLPGTTTGVVRPLVEQAARGGSVGLGVNPEFLTEGQAVDDFMHPDRIVLGADDPKTLEVLERLYEGFDGVRMRTTPTTAETIKLASNALLATMISFANELADLAAARGDIDAADVLRGLHLSRYLTAKDGEGRSVTAPLAAYLEPGCGFGGSCLPKDLVALHRHARSVGSQMEVLEAVDRVNRRRAGELVALVRRGLGHLDGARVSVLGVAFKPDTDDVRASPAFPVVEQLRAEGATVAVYDPVATAAFLAASPEAPPEAVSTLAEALDGDAVVIVTRWAEFERIPDLLRGRVQPPLVVDGRRMLEPSDVARYAGIGLGS